MPSVNMIAPRRAEKMRLERDMRRLVVVIVAELILAAGLGGWVCTKVWTTNGHIADLNVQLTKLQPVVKEIAGYETATQKLDPKLKLLGQAKESTMHRFNALDKLSQSLPQSTYLTRLSTTTAASQPGTVVDMDGISANQAKVGEFMLRVNVIPDFNGVDLHYTQRSGATSALEFEVGAKMKGSSEEVKKNGATVSLGPTPKE